METTHQITANHGRTAEKTSYPLFWNKLEFSRFGIISMLVVILGCIGGVAASFGAGDNILKLAMIAFPTIITLALILAVAPMKLITYMSILAIVLDMLVLIF